MLGGVGCSIYAPFSQMQVCFWFTCVYTGHVSSLLRVDDVTKSLVDRIANETGKTRQRILAEAIEAYERERFWRAFNTGYGNIMADPAARMALMAERHAESGSLHHAPDDQ